MPKLQQVSSLDLPPALPHGYSDLQERRRVGACTLQRRSNVPRPLPSRGGSISSHHSHFQASYKCFTLIAVQEPGTYKCPYNLGQTLSRAGATISHPEVSTNVTIYPQEKCSPSTWRGRGQVGVLLFVPKDELTFALAAHPNSLP